jgi:hypothetical protein
MSNKTKESSIMDFTHLSLEELESQVVSLFPYEKNSHAFFHMELLDALSFRFICNHWEKEEVLEMFGKMMDFSIDTLEEIDAEDEMEEVLTNIVQFTKSQKLLS